MCERYAHFVALLTVILSAYTGFFELQRRTAMRGWAELNGRAPSSYDWSRTPARPPAPHRGTATAPGRRLARAATVSGLYGTWDGALADVFAQATERQGADRDPA